MNKSTTKKIAVGALVAGAAGYLAGILTAPKSGKETRKDIKNKAEATTAEAEKRLKQLHTEINDLIAKAKSASANYSGKAKSELEKLIGVASGSKQKAREVLSAVHEEGAAEDKDLKKAVDETTKAIEHLKTFLKK